MPDQPNPNIARSAVGAVRYPPGHLLPHGSELTINIARFGTADTGGIVTINNWNVFQGTLVSFHFSEDGRQRITGSGVMVGPGIFLGATHVIEPNAPRMESGEIEGIISALTPSGILLWHPQHIATDPSCDISIIPHDC